ncbi:MAG: transferase hexapeptide repeat containing protein [Cytophagaceae bacterium]|jgi:acetyltransferase-like isoleucine patch superfamily enzyme|nr:transferase hexapeptide repeat containing protein [Cytophagaceae bacterium]
MIRRLKYYGANLMLGLLPLANFPRLNRILFKLQGVQIEPNTKIYSSVKFQGAVDVSIGQHTFIGDRTVFTGGRSAIKIGSYCDVSDQVVFVTGTHRVDAVNVRTAGEGRAEDIIVEDGVWVGYRALILPGVTIGYKSIIGAGCVVSKNVPPRSVVVGNPMVILKSI